MKLGSIKVAMLLAPLVAVFGVAACDPSKAELDKTKGELATVTSERDNLKTQLDQANQKAAQLQQQVTDLQAKAAAPVPEPAAVAEPEKDTKKGATKKSASKKEPAAATGTPPAPPANEAELKANPAASRKGRGAF